MFFFLAQTNLRREKNADLGTKNIPGPQPWVIVEALDDRRGLLVATSVYLTRDMFGILSIEISINEWLPEVPRARARTQRNM